MTYRQGFKGICDKRYKNDILDPVDIPDLSRPYFRWFKLYIKRVNTVSKIITYTCISKRASLKAVTHDATSLMVLVAEKF